MTTLWLTGKIYRYPLWENDTDIVQMILSGRSTVGDRVWMTPTLDDLHDPFLFPGMQESVDRVLLARERGERVVIFGDYDVDGVSGTTLLVRYFTELGIPVSYRIPHRAKDGYGMKPYFFDELAEKWVKLVISVDCGTRDIETIRYAKSLGIDVIITDHHSVPECIPEEAIAILSPKLRDTPYPYRDLSGSGMAFKLLSAIAQGLEPEKYRDILSRYIDFATLGTIADMMPLTGENRTIVKLGLAQITQSESPALRTLIEGKNTRSADVVGFHIGPRINAAGRMESAYTALHLLLSGSSGVAKILAEIEDMNLRRRATTTHFTELALSEIDPTQPLIVFRSDEIDHGILGLVAGRIAEEHQKPTIVAREEGGRIVGSARSPKSVHITELFETEKSRFVAFGGHAQAAGFTVESSNFESLISALRTTLTERNAGKGIPVSEPLMIDRILDLGDLTLSLVETIESVGPYGIGFPKPLFALWLEKLPPVELLGDSGDHIRFVAPRGVKLTGFWLGEYRSTLAGHTGGVELIGEIDRESWQGRESVVFFVRDVVLI